ncbi:MAG TPA: Ig-like domain-containing protein [Gemmatimonadaceae bacterium]|nr:Ig-like domain-containing protein [Gemmatimonadaceae bacterium]
MRRLIAAVALLACASQGDPPGGPPDAVAPVLVGILPESGAVNVRPERVEFRFDEVVSERPSGATSLEQMVLISPNDGLPRVDWRRRSIAVRPRRDWKANAVYTVTLLPGITDLRGNVMRTGASVIFSTGATIPDTRIAGILYDWVAGSAARAGAVEAIALPDSIVYVARTDSAGRFALAHLPPGSYVLRAWLDANNNRDLDPREAYDSASVALRDTASLTLFAFVHDTLPPRINTVQVVDSMTLRVELNQPLDPEQPLDTTRFRLTASDSSALALRAVFTADSFDRTQADSIARADTTRRAPPRQAPATPRDSVVLPRPIPVSRFVVVTALPLQPETSYRLIAIDARNLMGRTGTSARVFTTPRRAPADTTRQAPPP